MYDEKLLFESQLLNASDTPVSLADGSIDLTALDGLRAAGAEGKLKITLRANGTGVLDKDTTVTLTEMSLATAAAAGTFVANIPSNARVIIASAADLVFKDKEEVMSMLVSKEASKFIRPTLACGGTFGDTVLDVDIFLEYIPS